MSPTRRRRWPWVLLAAVVALVTVVYVGGGYYFSSVVNNDVFAVRPGVPARTQTGTLGEVTPAAAGAAGRARTLADAQVE